MGVHPMWISGHVVGPFRPYVRPLACLKIVCMVDWQLDYCEVWIETSYLHFIFRCTVLVCVSCASTVPSHSRGHFLSANETVCHLATGINNSRAFASHSPKVHLLSSTLEKILINTLDKGTVKFKASHAVKLSRKGAEIMKIN